MITGTQSHPYSERRSCAVKQRVNDVFRTVSAYSRSKASLGITGLDPGTASCKLERVRPGRSFNLRSSSAGPGLPPTRKAALSGI